MCRYHRKDQSGFLESLDERGVKNRISETLGHVWVVCPCGHITNAQDRVNGIASSWRDECVQGWST